MFPIPWNFPFRKKDGTLGKINDLASKYTLPVASSETLGGVKIGSGISIDSSGAISTQQYTLPVASSESLGGVKIGSGITIDENGAISASAGTEVQYLVKPVSISSGMSDPPNNYDFIPYSELPYNAVILSCQYTSHDTQATKRSAIIAYLGRGTETGVEARWLLLIDTTTGSKIVSSGDVVISYIVPQS